MLRALIDIEGPHEHAVGALRFPQPCQADYEVLGVSRPDVALPFQSSQSPGAE